MQRYLRPLNILSVSLDTPSCRELPEPHSQSGLGLCVCIFFFFFLAALGLCCCVRAFSSGGERGLLFIVVRGLLIAVASLVAERGL